MYKSYCKRVLDLLISLSFIVLIAPVLIVVAILVKTSDGGSVFFSQTRLGQNGRVFRIWKFRSMIEGADDYIDAAGAPTRMRITWVGKWLRKFSLDELPQLINIVKGDMSIVGPRPALPAQFPRYTDAQRERLAIRPGVTGLAQVNGRNTLPWSKRVEFDIEYVRNVSLYLDIKIVLLTAMQVITGTGVVMDRNPGDVDDLGPPRSDVSVPKG